MRYITFFVVALVAIYMVLQAGTMNRSQEVPDFLKVDQLAMHHQTTVEIFCEANECPDDMEMEILKRDYSNLWAHLNHLYNTGDLVSGKTYYTERWFRRLVDNGGSTLHPNMTRRDIHHHLYILNWSKDGLLCTAIDKDLMLEYVMPDGTKISSRVDVVLVLLYQGDHWRIDAMRVLDASSVPIL